LNVLSKNNFKVKDPGQHQIANTYADSIITTLISEINPDSIEYFMQSLEDYGTRYAFAPNRFEIANWLKEEFIRFGFSDVDLDSFEQHITWPIDSTFLQVNVVATLTGTEREDDIYIIGGHYDATSIYSIESDQMINAPGADDDASGTASVIEIARVLKKMNYHPEATIKFICFASEEIGSPETGSQIYAENALNSGMKIKVMINNDMIGYTELPVENSMVNINKLSGFEEYGDFAIAITDKYSILQPEEGLKDLGSDSTPFARRGFPAIYFSEHEWNPNYHKVTDLVIYCSMDYCAEVTRASLASLISVMGMPQSVKHFNVVDMGNGNSLLVNWSPPTDEDLEGYWISIGTDSGTYDASYSTFDTTMIIDELIEGVEYYVGITAYDMEGYESFLIEKTGTPNSLPLSPKDISEVPLWHQVQFTWSSNLEYDLLGYNIYRSLNNEELGDKINSEVVLDTTFTDDSPENGVYYYYTVKAIDSMQNESMNNLPIKSRAVSLDQGIVLVDETSDGNGSILNPTDEQADEFYNLLLERFERQNFDIIEEEGISLKDLGAFSTVIWHGSDHRDVTTASEILDDIQNFLDFGGNLIYTGFLPSEAFEGNTLYPADFETGDFIYDYLKISHVENIFGSRFVGALPVSNDYSSLFTDSSKTSPNTNYHLPFIEGISAGPEGTEIYLYETYFDTSTSQGSMKGEAVGVEYIGDDYKVVTLSFPLFYMNLDESKSLIEYILINKFNEVVSLEDLEHETIATTFDLSQNYPNPFNPRTVISYKLPVISEVEVSIFNLLGQKVVTLVSEKQSAGVHQLEWDAGNLASGVYYYVLRAGEFRAVRKMVLMR